MHIIKEKDGDILRVSLEGSMNYIDKDKFKDVAFAFSKNGIKKIELNVEKLDYMDSNSLGMFMVMHEDSLVNDGKIVIKNLNGKVDRLFRLSKLQNMFNIE